RNDAKSIVVQYVHCKKIDCKRYHIVGSQVMQHCGSQEKAGMKLGNKMKSQPSSADTCRYAKRIKQ
ncbi:MAG: hypothetical protein WAZ77_21970, partial [Candidatus Nitrosopolaris sp.]